MLGSLACGFACLRYININIPSNPVEVSPVCGGSKTSKFYPLTWQKADIFACGASKVFTFALTIGTQKVPGSKKRGPKIYFPQGPFSPCSHPCKPLTAERRNILNNLCCHCSSMFVTSKPQRNSSDDITVMHQTDTRVNPVVSLLTEYRMKLECWFQDIYLSGWGILIICKTFKFQLFFVEQYSNRTW